MPASTSTAPPFARTTRRFALHRRHGRSCRCVAYCGTRETPCDASPCASAYTSARAVASAIAAFAPARESALRRVAQRRSSMTPWRISAMTWCVRAAPRGVRGRHTPGARRRLSRPGSLRTRKARQGRHDLSAMSPDTRAFDSAVTPAMRRQQEVRASARAASPAGSGSCSNTSSAAPPQAIRLERAAATAASSTTPPRAVLIRIAPALHPREARARRSGAASRRPAARAA